MSGHTKKDKFWNNYIRDKVGVAPIEEKIIKIRLQWFKHVQRKLLEIPVRKVDQWFLAP